MSFPPMRYDEEQELYGSRPINSSVAGLLRMFYTPVSDSMMRVGYSRACGEINANVMGDLYSELVEAGIEVVFGSTPGSLEAVQDLAHKAMAFGEAKMLARLTIVAQQHALEECPAANHHAV